MELIDADHNCDNDKSIENKTSDNIKSSFSGYAYIYDDEVFVDTMTGEGYDAVLSKMKHYVDWYSGKIRLAGFDKDDIKQLIIMMILDGIRRYNPNKGVRLSTFLYIHIHNRMISRIREDVRQSLNATYNDSSYKCFCPCGELIISNKGDMLNVVCKACGSKIDNTWTLRLERHEPVSLEHIMCSPNINEQEKQSIMFYAAQKNSFVDFFGNIENIEKLDHKLDILNVLKKEDAITQKIARLVYEQDYSLTAAAKEVGLTCWAASLRLKKLKNKKHIKELFLNE